MTDQMHRPFLISQDPDGQFRLTVRDVRYNSQNYPIVTGTLQDECFSTAAQARKWARDHFNAKAGQYATK